MQNFYCTVSILTSGLRYSYCNLRYFDFLTIYYCLMNFTRMTALLLSVTRFPLRVSNPLIPNSNFPHLPVQLHLGGAQRCDAYVARSGARRLAFGLRLDSVLRKIVFKKMHDFQNVPRAYGSGHKCEAAVMVHTLDAHLVHMSGGQLVQVDAVRSLPSGEGNLCQFFLIFF